MRCVLLLCLLCWVVDSFAQKRGKKVQFVGGARALMYHSDFFSDKSDTVTAPKSLGGYALMDLGIKINPNSQTEIVGMFRMNSSLGGFWGSAVTFDVRQLYVRGVAADVLRYQLGTIDYKLTPYTMFNHNPDMLLPSVGTMRIKEDVLNYESFFTDRNTWRQQGAAVNFALQFPKVIEEIDFNAFIFRLNPSNFQNVFERLYGGGNIAFRQSKYFSLGINHVSAFDLAGTAASDDVYSNNVSTLTYDFTYEKDAYRLGLDGESGISSSKSKDSLSTTPTLTDYFIHARAYFNLKKINLAFDLGYMDNGPDFRSVGAQSKRVDFGQQNNFYQRYTNNQIVRPLSYFDLYNDPSLHSRNMSMGVMDYSPEINNALPYGLASFNRRGAYVGTSYADSLKIIEAEAKYYFLQEIRGQGTSIPKTFHYLKGNLKFDIAKLIKWENKLSLETGLAYQKTVRKSDLSYEQVNLNSLIINAGIEVEPVEKLSFILNFFAMKSKGNELLPVRDENGTIFNYSPYTIDGIEWNMAGGLRFNFTEKIYLAAFYEWNKNTFVADNPYRYSQASIYYVMEF